MRIAIPHWLGRISPVFDVAGTLLLVDVTMGQITGQHNVDITEETPLERARCVEGFGVDMLICGAISWPLEQALVAHGIEVFSQTCGKVEDVMDAFLCGRLEQDAFLMPGCCRQRRQHRRVRPRKGPTSSAQ